MDLPEPVETFEQRDAGAKLMELVRWVAVFPVAFVGATLANMLFNLGNSPGCTRGMVDPENSLVDASWLAIVGGGVTGYAVVVLGAWTAPRLRSAAGVVVGIAYVFFLGGLFFLSVAAGGETGWSVVRVLARVVGVAVGVYALMSTRQVR